ncbi:MAG: leucyl/phenylalanyl-tRNA--protein transferase [Gammaproteobacteria bacterium]|nr:leucyl/phenylalanyl-tRNA--protein transferase [Gammaproteobacteria bacterium]
MDETEGPYWLEPDSDPAHFPDPALALEEPNGLLAVGGDLSPARLLNAYRQGIFPWYSKGEPILWWSPDPRTVLFPAQLHLSRSLRKTLRRHPFRVTLDSAFAQVMEACSASRWQKDGSQSGTWISDEMKAAYGMLHRIGFAHSVECWQGEELVGGLYGVSMGKVFYGESMFSRCPDASKVGFAHLVRQLTDWGFALIDCQVYSNHLATLGAVEIPRERFLTLLDAHCDPFELHQGKWQLDEKPDTAW